MKQQILDIIERHATPFLEDRSLHQDNWNIVAEEIVELIGQKNAAQKDEEKEFLEMFNRIKGNYFDRAAKRFVPTRNRTRTKDKQTKISIALAHVPPICEKSIIVWAGLSPFRW